MSAYPRVSVIVIFDRDNFNICLPSLLDQSYSDYEILAVVNPGVNISDTSEKLKIIEMSDRNPARRRNIAAKQAAGRILAFIDDDAAAPRDWLEKGILALTSNPQWSGMGGANLLFPGANLGEWISDLILTTPLIGSGNPTYKLSSPIKTARPGDLHLSNMFITREIFQLTRGFNERLGYGAEDSEFIYIANKNHGARFGFAPDVFVHHHRRPFGLAYLTQRFRFRSQNGRLIWVYPDMYLGNKSLLLFLPLLLSIMFSLALFPALILPYVILYAVICYTLALPKGKEKPILFLFIPLFFTLHHAAYLLGLTAGLLQGIPDHGQNLRWRLGRKLPC